MMSGSMIDGEILEIRLPGPEEELLGLGEGVIVKMFIAIQQPPRMVPETPPKEPLGYIDQPLPEYYLKDLAEWKKSRVNYEMNFIVYNDRKSRIDNLKLGPALVGMVPVIPWTVPKSWVMYSKTDDKKY